MALTKSELALILAEKIGLNARESRDMIGAFFEEIRLALSEGLGVKLSGFGHFEVRQKGPRPGRNPKTGEVVPISPRRVVTFHPSGMLRAKCQQARR